MIKDYINLKQTKKLHNEFLEIYQTDLYSAYECMLSVVLYFQTQIGQSIGSLLKEVGIENPFKISELIFYNSEDLKGLMYDFSYKIILNNPLDEEIVINCNGFTATISDKFIPPFSEIEKSAANGAILGKLSIFIGENIIAENIRSIGF